jgi:hypothetical protein
MVPLPRPEECAFNEAANPDAGVVAVEQAMINMAISYERMSIELTRNDEAHLRALYSLVTRMHRLLLTVNKSPRCFQAVRSNAYWATRPQKPKQTYVAKWVVDSVIRPRSTTAKENAGRISAILHSFVHSNVPDNEVENRIRAAGGIQKCYLAICPAAVARAEIDLLRSEPATGTTPPPEDDEEFDHETCHSMIAREPSSKEPADALKGSRALQSVDDDVPGEPPNEEAEGPTEPAGSLSASPLAAAAKESRLDDMVGANYPGRPKKVAPTRFDRTNMLAVEMCPHQLAELLKAKRAVIRISILKPDESGFSPVIMHQAELSFTDEGRWPDVRFPSDDEDTTTRNEG